MAFWSTLALAPGAVAGALLGTKRSDRKGLAALGAAGVAAGLGVLRWQLGRWFSEEPAYQVEERGDGFEIRRYAPTVRAETTVHADSWKGALNEGFETLAGYIFGDNEGSERIAMRAPVFGKPNGGEKLPMTAPVMATPHAEGRYDFSFVMPHDRDLASLPKPKNGQVRLVEVPEQRVAVLTFRGSYAGDLPAKKQKELLEKVWLAGYQPSGEPSFAGYDPPTTLPFLRRNEAWVTIEEGVKA